MPQNPQESIFTCDLIREIPVSCLSYLFPANNPRTASDAAQRCFSAPAPPLKRKSEDNFPLLTGHLSGVLSQRQYCTVQRVTTWGAAFFTKF